MKLPPNLAVPKEMAQAMSARSPGPTVDEKLRSLVPGVRDPKNEVVELEEALKKLEEALR